MWGARVNGSTSGLVYRRAGDGVPVVLLHGVPGSAMIWKEVAEQLPGSLDVIVPDLLGFGASRRPHDLAALHAVGQAEALDRLLGELGVTRAVVVGHDFGGPVAIALSARHPDAVGALALMSTNTFGDTPIPFPLSTTVWPVVGALARRVIFSRSSLGMMLRQAAGTGAQPLDAQAYLGDEAQSRAIATIFAGSLLHLRELYGPLESQLAALTVPTFVAWGDRDPFFPLALGERTARLAKSELHVYRGAGHFLPDERAEDVARDLATFTATLGVRSERPRP